MGNTSSYVLALLYTYCRLTLDNILKLNFITATVVVLFLFFILFLNLEITDVICITLKCFSFIIVQFFSHKSFAELALLV